MKPYHPSRCSVAVAGWLCVAIAAPMLSAQDWLADQSFRPTAQQPPIPTIPSEGLFEPPPPLERSMPPTVFEEEAAKQAVDMGPVWYYPWTWIPLDGWENSAELGLNGSAGNA